MSSVHELLLATADPAHSLLPTQKPPSPLRLLLTDPHFARMAARRAQVMTQMTPMILGQILTF